MMRIGLNRASHRAVDGTTETPGLLKILRACPAPSPAWEPSVTPLPYMEMVFKMQMQDSEVLKSDRNQANTCIQDTFGCRHQIFCRGRSVMLHRCILPFPGRGEGAWHSRHHGAGATALCCGHRASTGALQHGCCTNNNINKYSAPFLIFRALLQTSEDYAPRHTREYGNHRRTSGFI